MKMGASLGMSQIGQKSEDSPAPQENPVELMQPQLQDVQAPEVNLEAPEDETSLAKRNALKGLIS